MFEPSCGQLVELETDAARHLLDELEEKGWQISEEDFGLAMRVRLLPNEVMDAADDRVADLEKRKQQFAEELSQQQQVCAWR